MRARLARLSNAVVWRLPGRAARKLFSFAQAEQSSLLDLLAAARLTTSPARRQLYLQHAVDEARHAVMFAARSSQLQRQAGRASFGHPDADMESLFERLGEPQFLAFVHRGERRGRQQFETYRDYFTRIADDRSRAMFEAILVDERRHESYSRELLVELSGGEEQAKSALRRAAAWEAWRVWRRGGRFIAGNLFALTMILLYFAITPIALAVRLLSPPRRGWTT
jgi:rubrerythrin